MSLFCGNRKIKEMGRGKWKILPMSPGMVIANIRFKCFICHGIVKNCVTKIGLQCVFSTPAAMKQL
uniref:Uncharacterized protein n=1 Tax=Rhizophora mucronata TaxID=61149 RepID=A0A2P2NCF6_RHIMU